MAGDIHRSHAWTSYSGYNLAYLLEQYEAYSEDPLQVEEEYRRWFEEAGPPPAEMQSERARELQGNPLSTSYPELVKKIADQAERTRSLGHLFARLDPLGLNRQRNSLEDEELELEPSDLEMAKQLPAHYVLEQPPGSIQHAQDALAYLRKVYTGTIAYEFAHIFANRERAWFREQIESEQWPPVLSTEEKKSLLERLVQVHELEDYLQHTFVGQKRFSIEGNDVLVPMLDELIRCSQAEGTRKMLLGMAHRGRLNVLAHVLKKPYSTIFSEFYYASGSSQLQASPDEEEKKHLGWTGDVKYHLGASCTYGDDFEIVLANNPSHLEYVNPIVEGMTRAAQERRDEAGMPKQKLNEAVTVILHGDAAFIGEGIVPETLNFNRLEGYRNGGTIHFIVNNGLGFTTQPIEARSTHYASDVAKGFDIPVLHVNADDPEACMAAVRLACQYRNSFHKDIVIDLIGYRRHGHNEMDDPSATQPRLYEKVNQHPPVSKRYAEWLSKQGVLDTSEVSGMREQAQSSLKKAYEEMKELDPSSWREVLIEEGMSKLESASAFQELKQPKKMSLEQLAQWNEELLDIPDHIEVYPKLRKILERRRKMLESDGKVDWGLAEALAFASILSEGIPIRMSGQDSQRGTFAHRHAVLHDIQSREQYVPLQHLSTAKASFILYNSPLSEAAVLGYEYGYQQIASEALVLWEAQFGDFGNAAQVIIDQFISSGLAKWKQYSNIVLLLPHGYEGQGPEHSSARLERFLHMSAEGNWIVANVSTSAQYFHLLRRQAEQSGTRRARPLIVMSPKSLLRSRRAAADPNELINSSFKKLYEDPLLGSDREQVTRLILCSGKVAVDLQEAIEEHESDWSWLHIVRVEQLYPFPMAELEEFLQELPALKEMVWVQEEPQNMGAWRFVQPHLNILAPEDVKVQSISRPPRSSTASGYAAVHENEQKQMIADALQLNRDGK
ncbi:2-oxoglutarate dehydrogenase E1 component [Marinicrinis sediminis]|uniref:oxoglutarate dehydrogenase (succinyl-transferring) n=1 Tax=Marinicrinis sediminis TaxID=1652465 RepID=A0ABW5R865_9BACL